MKIALIGIALIAGCPAPPKDEPPIPLPPQDAKKLEEWNAIVRGMRMDVLDDAGRVTRERISVQEVCSPSKPVVLALWASYCPPCLEEMPMFDELAKEGHQIIGISLDDNLPDVAKVLDEMSPDYPQGVLQQWSMKRVGQSLPNGIPFTMVLNKKGQVRYVFPGKTSKSELLSALGRL